MSRAKSILQKTRPTIVKPRPTIPKAHVNKRVTLIAHFDEANIDKTYHPKQKDYGLMPITESKTPFPRKEDPVDASLLREKLLAMNKEFSLRRSSTMSDFDFDIEVTTDSKSDSKEFDSFLEKRKKFDTAEFLITKQHPTCNDLHIPGHSVPSSLLRSSTTSAFTIAVPLDNSRRSTTFLS